MADATTAAKTKAEFKSDLLTAAQAAVEDAHDRASRPRRVNSRAGRLLLGILGGALFGLGIYIIAARPGWFFTPDPAPPTTEVEQASVRLMLVREAARVNSFRSVYGVLPNSLAEAGSPVSGVRYSRSTDSTFRLSTQVGANEIVFYSDAATDAFLGNSVGVVTAREE